MAPALSMRCSPNEAYRFANLKQTLNVNRLCALTAGGAGTRHRQLSRCQDMRHQSQTILRYSMNQPEHKIFNPSANPLSHANHRDRHHPLKFKSRSVQQSARTCKRANADHRKQQTKRATSHAPCSVICLELSLCKMPSSD